MYPPHGAFVALSSPADSILVTCRMLNLAISRNYRIRHQNRYIDLQTVEIVSIRHMSIEGAAFGVALWLISMVILGMYQY